MQREVKDSSTEVTALAEPIMPREMNKIRSSFFTQPLSILVLQHPLGCFDESF